MPHPYLLATALALAALSCGLPRPQHEALIRPVTRGHSSFVVLGDTQRSLWVEEHLAGREQNDDERARLIDQLAREESPAFVVHLGDLVAKASPEHWRYFDLLMAPLTDAKLRIFPVLGNHEYFGVGRDPTRSARLRYPDLASGGYYAKRWGHLGLVWLDSNLGGRAAKRQAEWLARVLRLLDDTPGIDGTLVFTHHPPFTNGEDRHGHPTVRDQLLPVIESSKTIALFSAHVHGYERFDAGGLAVVVSGGGGGPRVEYRTGQERSLAPAALDSEGVRPLSYVVVRDAGDRVIVTSRCLKQSSGCPEGGTLDEVTLAVPPKPRPRAFRHR